MKIATRIIILAVVIRKMRRFIKVKQFWRLVALLISTT